MGKVEVLAERLVETQVCLRIMATTDLHMQVLPFNYLTGQETANSGLARTASLIHQARQEQKNSILLDCGDFLSGTVSKFEGNSGWPDGHPFINVMNYLEYDAVTPGNHDFDHGLQFLQDIAKQAKFPLVSANVLSRRGITPGQDQTLFNPFKILRRTVTDHLGLSHELRIGITGFLPPASVAKYDNNNLNITTRDILEAARAVLPKMKKAGADIIIVLAHSGIGPETPIPNMENAAIPLAELAGIDAVIAGHKHQVFPGPGWQETQFVDPIKGTIHGKPVVSAGFWGSHLGLIDLDLNHKNGRWSVRQHKSEVRPIFARCDLGHVTAKVKSDPNVQSIITPTHIRLLNWIKRPLGQTNHPLTSFFAYAAPSRALQVVQRAQVWFVNQHGLDQHIPILSSATLYKTGGCGNPESFTNIQAGRITYRDIADLYPFPNQIAVTRITGSDLREWLERAASVFNRAIPGSTQTLKPADLPAYLIETVFGVEYVINLARDARYDQMGKMQNPDAHRITNLRYQGREVTADQTFFLITNNYRLSGGGSYPRSCLNNRVAIPPFPIQDVLASYFEAHPNLEPTVENHWRFAHVPGAEMTFRSVPKAVPHLAGTTGHFQIRPKAKDRYGYQQFSLHL